MIFDPTERMWYKHVWGGTVFGRIFRRESVELAEGLSVREAFLGQCSPHHKDQTALY